MPLDVLHAEPRGFRVGLEQGVVQLVEALLPVLGAQRVDSDQQVLPLVREDWALQELVVPVRLFLQQQAFLHSDELLHVDLPTKDHDKGKLTL